MGCEKGRGPEFEGEEQIAGCEFIVDVELLACVLRIVVERLTICRCEGDVSMQWDTLAVVVVTLVATRGGAVDRGTEGKGLRHLGRGELARSEWAAGKWACHGTN